MKPKTIHPNYQRGWATVETAFAALGLGLALVVCAGALGVTVDYIRCNEAAAQLARCAAIDDLEAMTAIIDRLPEAAQWEIQRIDDSIIVTITISRRPWGRWLPAINLTAQAEAAYEAGTR
ncbi:MAG: hypothetical protein FWD55_00315 [Propionibacteriaceae bacterium]|nr:hypothetical protein [Propionibacteriaceae bacterium]